MGTDRPADAKKTVKPSPSAKDQADTGTRQAGTRQAREAEALRHNLQRRKSQQRARRDEDKAD